MVRLNKYLADQGLASRREADMLITDGKVIVNGQTAVLGQKVSPQDKVELVGRPAPKQYLAYYKGRGIISHSPAKDEEDIAGRLKRDYGLSGIYPLGRLDKDSEGLMILTNDGRLTGRLLDPKADHEKEYEVTVNKPVRGAMLKKFRAGINIEGHQTKPAKAIANENNLKRFRLILTEGKKHQIRRMCAALGLEVENLKRVRIMNIKLGKLKPNQYRKLTVAEKRGLLKSLGLV